MSNPLDSAALLRDLHRRDECEYLYELVAHERNQVAAGSDPTPQAEAKRTNYLAALDLVSNLIDGRIQQLQDKWD